MTLENLREHLKSLESQLEQCKTNFYQLTGAVSLTKAFIAEEEKVDSPIDAELVKEPE